jgi:hypothetical protein
MMIDTTFVVTAPSNVSGICFCRGLPALQTMKTPSTPKQKPKPPQHVLDLVRNTKAKLAEKRKEKFSQKSLLGLTEVPPRKDEGL